MATSLVTLLPPTGRTRVWNGEPSWNRARSIVPAPMSATATPSSFSVSVRTASAGGQRVDDQFVDLDAGRADALGQVLDGRGRGRDDVRLDLEAQGAHPERVLDALLAVDREPAPLDVEHLAIGRDRHRARDVDGAVDVLAGDLAVVTGDGDLARTSSGSRRAGRRRRRRPDRSSSRTGARRARPRRRSSGPSGRC